MGAQQNFGTRPVADIEHSATFLVMLYRKLSLLIVAIALVICAWIGTISYVQRTRMIEGTWIDLFEGSSFFENQTVVDACGPYFDRAPWMAYYPSDATAEGRMVSANRNSGEFISKHGRYPVAAYHVKFVGRRKVSEFLGLGTLLGFGYGHLGAFGSEFQVDQMTSIRPIPHLHCDVR